MSVAASDTGKKTVDLVKLECGGVALQHAELHAANVVGTGGGLLGEEVNPAGVAPVQNDEAALGEALLKAVRDVVANVVQFLIGGKHHGDLQGGDVWIDAAESGAGERDGLEFFDAKLLNHFGFVALFAAGINL